VSKRSVVNIGFGVTWASAGGLAVYSTTIGTDYLTKNVHSWTTWPIAVTPSALIGTYYRGRYFGADGTNTFLFERNDQVGGHLIESDIDMTAAHYRVDTDEFYYVDGNTVQLWNSPNAGPRILDWKSKVFTTKQYINMGAARVIADYIDPDALAQLQMENDAIQAANEALMADPNNLMGSLGGFMGNEFLVAGGPIQPLLEPSTTALFQLFVDKELIFSRTCTDSEPFRLPATYRSDTFEFRVATTARVRAIHVAETMNGLRTV
jgi:hypothetical protein